jgi:outer membrane receptor for monomeric catechols
LQTRTLLNNSARENDYQEQHLRILNLALAILPAAAAPALAAAPAEDAGRIEEIVVTADRASGFGASLVQVGTFRNARLVDVPLTVNVVPRALLDAQAATGLYDALRNTAGVSRSQLSGTRLRQHRHSRHSGGEPHQLPAATARCP